MASADKSVRTLAGRIGGYTVHARHDSDAIAARARAGLRQKFVDEVQDAAAERGETLTKRELERRVEFTRKAYYTRLALKSAAARRKGGDAA